jgi:hypothetical protein
MSREIMPSGWPKLEPGQTVRIVDMKTGKYYYKPRGPGRSSLEKSKFTAYSSWNGPAAKLNEWRQAERLNESNGSRWYPEPMIETRYISFEILEPTVVYFFNAAKIITAQDKIAARAAEERQYKTKEYFKFFQDYSTKEFNEILKTLGEDLRVKKDKFEWRIHQYDYQELRKRVIAAIAIRPHK